MLMFLNSWLNRATKSLPKFPSYSCFLNRLKWNIIIELLMELIVRIRWYDKTFSRKAKGKCDFIAKYLFPTLYLGNLLRLWNLYLCTQIVLTENSGDCVCKTFSIVSDTFMLYEHKYFIIFNLSKFMNKLSRLTAQTSCRAQFPACKTRLRWTLSLRGFSLSYFASQSSFLSHCGKYFLSYRKLFSNKRTVHLGRLCLQWHIWSRDWTQNRSNCFDAAKRPK